MSVSPSAALSRPGLWFLAIRPRTLPLSLTPVLVGAAFSWAEAGMVNGLAMAAAALGAMLIQIGANLYNDASDFERGADGPNRLGPSRVTANGLMTAAEVKKGAFVCFGAVILLGAYLASVGGWPILLLGVASIFCGWAYTGGPRPIAYTPLSEAFVVLFFGIGAVGGTIWLNLGFLPPAALTAGFIMGLFAAAVSFVNNYRDVDQDIAAGRRTLAILVGDEGGRLVYIALLGVAFFLTVALMRHFPDRHCWLALGALPFGLRAIQRFIHSPREKFNPLLGETARIQMFYGILLSIGLLWR